MIVKLLAGQHLEFLGLERAAGARPGLHVSECRIVGDLMSRLICKICLQPMSIVDACYLNPIYRNGTLCNPLSAVLTC